MNIERATYSSSAVNEAIRQTKAINATVNHKCEHFAKSQEIKKVYEYCENNVNRFCLNATIEVIYLIIAARLLISSNTLKKSLIN